MALSQMGSIYVQGYDVSCAGTNLDHYDESKVWHFWDERRLAHNRGPHRDCCNLKPWDTVTCLYIFGETLLVQKHLYGKCPYLLKKEV